jgi:hypothetical protein
MSPGVFGRPHLWMPSFGDTPNPESQRSVWPKAGDLASPKRPLGNSSQVEKLSGPFPAWWFVPAGRLTLCLCLSKEVDAVKLASAGVMKKLDGMLPGLAAVKIGESLHLVRVPASEWSFTHRNELIVAGLRRTRPSQPVQNSLNTFLKVEGTKVKPMYS